MNLTTKKTLLKVLNVPVYLMASIVGLFILFVFGNMIYLLILDTGIILSLIAIFIIAILVTWFWLKEDVGEKK